MWIFRPDATVYVRWKSNANFKGLSGMSCKMCWSHKKEHYRTLLSVLSVNEIENKHGLQRLTG